MKKEVETRVRDLHILSIVQKCTGWMEQVPKRLQTEGIFRVSGSAKVFHSSNICANAFVWDGGLMRGRRLTTKKGLHVTCAGHGNFAREVGT
jgi:hypothetical protein